jgi:signal peptidase I
MERRPPREWLRELLLTSGAVIGAICLLAAVGSVAFGLQPLIFRSGSMEPAIGTGALALARDVPAETVQVGDVVSVVAPSGTRITHRVVSTSPGPVTTLILKGDANRVADTQPYAVSEVAVVVAHVDYLGYVVSWLRHPAAIFLGGVVVGVLVMIAFTTRGSPPSGTGRHQGGELTGTADEQSHAAGPAPRRALLAFGSRTARLCVTRVAPMALVCAVVVSATGTRAAFADTATATGGSFATAPRIASTALSCTALGVLQVRFSWTAVTGVSGYDLVLTATGGGATTYSTAAGVTSTTVNGALGSGTAVVRAKVVYAATTWYSAPSNSRSYTFAAVSLCG